VINVTMLLNGKLGLKISSYLIHDSQIRIVGIIVNSPAKRHAKYLNDLKNQIKEIGYFVPIVSFENTPECLTTIRSIFQKSDFGVSALFGHILPFELLTGISCKIVNLHPSLLPIGRGADPIPWSLIRDERQGVSIHVIDSGLDTGGILAQKEIETNIGMNSGDIYEIACKYLYDEFVRIFPVWIKGGAEINPQPQVDLEPNQSKQLEAIRITEEGELGTFGYFIRKLQALKFSDGRKPGFRDKDGNCWEIDVFMSPVVQDKS
jgi:methionyl-tRNA formyltransferase